MAASIGNLAIVISGNARPFQKTLGQVKNEINQFSSGGGTQNVFKGMIQRQLSPLEQAAKARLDMMRAAALKHRMENPPPPRSALQWGSFGRLIRSSLVAGFGGGLAGALVGVGAMAFGQFLEATLGLVGAIGKQAASFLADSFQEGLKVSRMELGVNFLAGGPGRGGEWMQEIRSLSAKSGFDMLSLGQSMRTLAGSTDDLDTVVPTLQAIATISAGIGAEAEQMNRFALAVAQVMAAGRFEAQELNQLTEAGMPIKELAKTAGMSVGQFRAAVKDGEVSVSVLAQTFNRMVGPGGRFFGMLEERAKSAVGQVDRISAGWMLFKQELGKGLLDEARNAGFLNAIQNGIDYLLTHKDEVRSFIEQGAEQLKHWSVYILRASGNMYDFGVQLAKVFDLAWKAGSALRTAMKYITLGTSEMILKTSPLGMVDLARKMLKFEGGTGQKWVDEFLASFSRVKPAVADAFQPMVLALEMAPRLAKILDGVRSTLAEGASPYEKFMKGMQDIQKIKDFTAKKMQEDGLNRAIEQFGKSLGDILSGNGWMDGPLSGFGRSLEEWWGKLFGTKVMTPNEENQLIYQNFMELEKSLSSAFETKFPEAMSKGSQAAISAINAAMYSSGEKTIQERIHNVMALTKEAAAQTATNTKAIAEAVKAWKGASVGK